MAAKIFLERGGEKERVKETGRKGVRADRHVKIIYAALKAANVGRATAEQHGFLFCERDLHGCKAARPVSVRIRRVYFYDDRKRDAQLYDARII